MNLHPWQLTLTVRQRPLKTKKGSRLKISSGIDSGIRSLRRRSVPPVWPTPFIESSLLPHSIVGQVVSRLCPSMLQRIHPVRGSVSKGTAAQQPPSTARRSTDGSPYDLLDRFQTVSIILLANDPCPNFKWGTTSEGLGVPPR